MNYKWISASLAAVSIALAAGLYFKAKPTVYVVDTQRASNVLKNENKKLVGDETTREQLRDLMRNNENIVAISLVSVNFAMNSRQTVFFTSSDKALEAAVLKSAVYQPTPLFIFNDRVTNTRLISFFDEAIYCHPSSEAYIVKRVPEVATVAPVFCAVAVPPSKWFAGLINVFVKRELTLVEKNKLQFELQQVSKQIYLRETK